MIRPGLWTALALALFAPACKTIPAGDGVAQLNTVFLPRFPIGATGSFSFDVRYNEPTFPHWLHFHTREAVSTYPYTPFDRALFKVTIIAPNDKIAGSTLVRPRAPRIVGGDHYRVNIWTRDSARQLPPLTEYTVKIDVLRPSSRRFDKAQIYLGTRR